jgi:predicted DNA binding protein
MAQEANQESPIKVSFDSKTGHYLTTQDLGDFGISRMDYEIADGRIAVATDLDSKATRTIRYGALTDADMNILKTAVEQFLKKQ